MLKIKIHLQNGCIILTLYNVLRHCFITLKSKQTNKQTNKQTKPCGILVSLNIYLKYVNNIIKVSI